MPFPFSPTSCCYSPDLYICCIPSCPLVTYRNPRSSTSSVQTLVRRHHINVRGWSRNWLMLYPIRNKIRWRCAYMRPGRHGYPWCHLRCWQVHSGRHRCSLMRDTLTRSILGMYGRWWIRGVVHRRRRRWGRFACRNLLLLLQRKLDRVFWGVNAEAHEPSYVRVQRRHLYRRRWCGRFVAIHFGMTAKL